jgi:hypothetical protein
MSSEKTPRQADLIASVWLLGIGFLGLSETGEYVTRVLFA